MLKMRRMSIMNLRLITRYDREGPEYTIRSKRVNGTTGFEGHAAAHPGPACLTFTSDVIRR